MKELEIKVKGIIDIINRLYDIDTIVSLSKIVRSNDLCFVNVDVEYKGILNNCEFTIVNDVFNETYFYIINFISELKEVNNE